MWSTSSSMVWNMKTNMYFLPSSELHGFIFVLENLFVCSLQFENKNMDFATCYYFHTKHYSDSILMLTLTWWWLVPSLQLSHDLKYITNFWEHYPNASLSLSLRCEPIAAISAQQICSRPYQYKQSEVPNPTYFANEYYSQLWQY